MKAGNVMSSLLPALTLVAASTASATTYYVDAENGNDANTGVSSDDAIRSIGRVNSLTLGPGDAVLFKRQQSFPGSASISSSGSSTSSITLGAWGTGSSPVLFEINIRGDHIVINDLVVDHQKMSSDAIRIRGGRDCVIRNTIIRNGTRDGIDADDADGLLIENVEIHHFLNGSFGSQDDSHGIAVTGTNGVTIRNANIHHVSGDSFQSDPNRSAGNITDNIAISDSVFWTGPLQQDFNQGWRAGDSPGENAIDTKVLTSGFENEIRMNISLTNVTAHGWVAVPQISNRAAFNLKEKINATVNRVTVYDSEIAFRIRGGRGNADTTITNTVLYDVVKAIRSEDDLQNLKIFNTTFGDEIVEQIEHAGGSGGTSTWDLRNNAFLGARPKEAGGSTNIVAVHSDFSAPGQRRYQLSTGSDLIDRGDTIPGLTSDRDGRLRATPYDVGAYEHTATNGVEPSPPILSIQR